MSRERNWREIAELTGIAGIILSLVLVAYELRQSTAVSTAQAVMDLNAAVDSAYRLRAQDPELDRLVSDGPASLATLSERERSQLFAWIRADMNLLEAAWFYYDYGIISESRFDGYINSICSRVSTDVGKEWWKTEKEFYPAYFQADVDAWCYRDFRTEGGASK